MNCGCNLKRTFNYLFIYLLIVEEMSYSHVIMLRVYIKIANVGGGSCENL